MPKKICFVSLVFVLCCCTLALATNYTVTLSFDKDGKLVVQPDRTPTTGGLAPKDHIEWQAPSDCHVNLTIEDGDDPSDGETWSDPDDHGHSNIADVDTPGKKLDSNRVYKYSAWVWCDSGNADSRDPELVVAGGTFGQRGHPDRRAESSHYPSVQKITIFATESTAMVDKPSATVHIDQKVHWHGVAGDIRRIEFAESGVGTISCASNECERAVSDLTVGRRYKYSIVIRDSKGQEHTIDPELVIAGGQPRPKAKSRTASAADKRREWHEGPTDDTITVSVDDQHHVSLDKEIAPGDDAYYKAGSHITWKAADDCKLNVHFKDNQNPEPFPKPDCDTDEAPRNPCHARVHAAKHKDPKPYKYLVRIDCGGQKNGEKDPELVIGGGIRKHHRRRENE